MTKPERFGEFDSELLSKDKLLAREILKEINNFGISESQRVFLIQALSQELESIELSKEISFIIKDLSPNLFISRIEGGQ